MWTNIPHPWMDLVPIQRVSQRLKTSFRPWNDCCNSFKKLSVDHGGRKGGGYLVLPGKWFLVPSEVCRFYNLSSKNEKIREKYVRTLCFFLEPKPFPNLFSGLRGMAYRLPSGKTFFKMNLKRKYKKVFLSIHVWPRFSVDTADPGCVGVSQPNMVLWICAS